MEDQSAREALALTSSPGASWPLAPTRSCSGRENERSSPAVCDVATAFRSVDPVALAKSANADYLFPCWETRDAYPQARLTAGWVARNSCGTPATETYAQGDSACEAYPGCAGGGDVELCTVTGGGHQWPGGVAVPGLGNTTMDLDATARIWEFFVAHPR